MSIAAILIAVIHFLRPSLRPDTTYVAALVLAVIPWLAPLIKSVELPGGFKIEVQDLKEATDKLKGAVVKPLRQQQQQQQQQHNNSNNSSSNNSNNSSSNNSNNSSSSSSNNNLQGFQRP